MKFLKDPKPRSTKVIYGLFALLFILTAVHSSAILDLNFDKNSQLGQIISWPPSVPVNCLEITPRHSFIDIRNNIEYTFFLSTASTEFNKTTDFYFDIRNTCSYNIYVVSPYSMGNFGTTDFSHQYTRFQRSTSAGPTTIPVPSLHFDHPVETDYIELLSAPTQGFYPYAPSIATASTTPGLTLQSFMVSPNQTLTFKLTSIYPFKYMMASGAGSSLAVRATIDKIKWFDQAAIQDNVIVPKELKTYNIPDSLQNSLATSYIRVRNGCLCEGLEDLSPEEIEKMEKEMGLEGEYLLDPRREQAIAPTLSR